MRKRLQPRYFLSTRKFYLVMLCSMPLMVSSSCNAMARPTDEMNPLRKELAAAQQAKDLKRVEAIVEKIRVSLGSRAGVPEKADRYFKVDANARRLTFQDVPTAFGAYAKTIEDRSWWCHDVDPTTLREPLRVLANVITGCLAARRAGANDSERLLQLAREAGDFLIVAQTQARSGVYPFPSARGGKGGLPFAASEQLLRKWEADGKLQEAVVNGWIAKDYGDGGLNFDNGLCGRAMIELYEATQDPKYLRSAKAAGRYAMEAPVVPNWNYNAFSVMLLANLYRVTGDSRYLESAKEKARLGICPGQLKRGPNRGRWLDPHNARPAYHYIIVLALADLLSVMPEADPDYASTKDVLTRALLARNLDFARKGVCTAEFATEALVTLELRMPASSGKLKEAGRMEALDVLNRHIAGRVLEGKLPIAPSALGLLLEWLSRDSVNPS